MANVCYVSVLGAPVSLQGPSGPLGLGLGLGWLGLGLGSVSYTHLTLPTKA